MLCLFWSTHTRTNTLVDRANYFNWVSIPGNVSMNRLRICGSCSRFEQKLKPSVHKCECAYITFTYLYNHITWDVDNLVFGQQRFYRARNLIICWIRLWNYRYIYSGWCAKHFHVQHLAICGLGTAASINKPNWYEPKRCWKPNAGRNSSECAVWALTFIGESVTIRLDCCNEWKW